MKTSPQGMNAKKYEIKDKITIKNFVFSTACHEIKIDELIHCNPRSGAIFLQTTASVLLGRIFFIQFIYIFGGI